MVFDLKEPARRSDAAHRRSPTVRRDRFQRRGLLDGALESHSCSPPAFEGRSRSPKGLPTVTSCQKGGSDSYTPNIGDFTSSVKRSNVKVPGDLPPYVRELYRTPLLNADEEVDLFTRIANLKILAKRWESHTAKPEHRTGNERQLERIQTEITAVRNRIIEANLRLVFSIAKQFTGPGQPELFELVSEGNSVLLKAVDLFNTRYGNRFSTYATTAIRRHFMRICQYEYRQNQRYVTGSDDALARVHDSTTSPHSVALNNLQLQHAIRRLLDVLDGRERAVVEGRFGFVGEGRRLSFRELGEQLGVSKERVRQLLDRAIIKLHTSARRDRIELPFE